MTLVATIVILISCNSRKPITLIDVNLYENCIIEEVTVERDDFLKIKGIIQKGCVTTMQLYDKPNLVMFLIKKKDGAISQMLSVYQRDHVVYVGDWLDARTASMNNQSVDCILLTRSNVDWIIDLMIKKYHIKPSEDVNNHNKNIGNQ